jgi:ATP-binding cassette subfamily F protein 3
MIAVTFDRTACIYATDPIFKNLSWEIHDDRTIGLVGPNGSGKSTLLRMIAGEVISVEGRVIVRKGLRIGYLPQHPHVESGRSLWDEVFSAYEELRAVEERLEAVEAELADPSVYENAHALARVLAKQERLLAEFEQMGGPGYVGRVRSTLRDVGFREEDFLLPVDVLSGGQKKLAGLARLLVTRPDMLLLDEPDNHLDLAGKMLLERVVQGFSGGVVIVSHDRFLLDLVVDDIAELEDGKISVFTGSYSEYIFEKEMRLLRQQQLFHVQQREINRLEQAAKRLLLWGRLYDNNKFIRRGQNIEKRIERIEKIDRPVIERKRMDLQLSGWTGSQKVLEIVDLEKVFPAPEGGSSALFSGLNLRIMHGERVGLVGPNGAGKSVLFRMILGEEPCARGDIRIGPSIRVGYYAQQHETLSAGQTLIDTVRYAVERMKEEEAVAFLGKFLFTYNQARGLVGALSGGERSRLQMALLMLSGANFLLLDEPTNHLDVASAEVLETSLQEFEGTALVISHDRYFLDRVVTRIVELDQGRLHEYQGNYSDYQAKKNQG